MDGVTYVNGEMVPAGQANLPLNDLGIVRGFGIFDYLRTYGRVPFRLREHLLRLESSARQIELTLHWDLEELAEIVMDTYAANDHLPDAGIRIIATGGPSDNYMTPQDRTSLAVIIGPAKPYPARDYQLGRGATTTRIPRVMPTVKSLNYMGAIMAMKHADAVGAVEAIYRETDDTLTEGTRSNLFVVKGGKIITPVTDVLPGITRAAVIEAVSGEFEVVQRSLRVQDVLDADEAFLTSTTKEVMPMVWLDEISIADGKPGPVTARVMALFKELVTRECASVAV